MINKICLTNECERKHYAKGLCRLHYDRQHCASKPLYMIWKSMRQRCNNLNDKSYKHYGGRGIDVCESWDNFANFISDMGERPEGLTLERIDNNMGYSKENCRWATWREQRFNQRLASNNKSGVRGVCFHKQSGLYKSQMQIGGKRITKYCQTKEDAIFFRAELELLDRGYDG